LQPVAREIDRAGYAEVIFENSREQALDRSFPRADRVPRTLRLRVESTAGKQTSDCDQHGATACAQIPSINLQLAVARVSAPITRLLSDYSLGGQASRQLAFRLSVDDDDLKLRTRFGFSRAIPSASFFVRLRKCATLRGSAGAFEIRSSRCEFVGGRIDGRSS